MPNVNINKPNTVTAKRKLKLLMAKAFPLPFFLLQYKISKKRICPDENRDKLFDEFLSNTRGRCLQIAIKDEIGKKFGDNWTAVDKYSESPSIDNHDDIQALSFPDSTFDAIVCWSVLEHVPDPHQAIREMYRVLQPGGIIWVQLPFLYPYHSSPHDYWRVTPSGLRMWMKDFEERSCGCNYWAGTSLVAATYFYGKKR